jgi:hypothetical protein
MNKHKSQRTTDRSSAAAAAVPALIIVLILLSELVHFAKDKERALQAPG